MATLYESFNDTFAQLPIKLYKHNLEGTSIWAPLHWHRSIEVWVPLEGRICFNIGSDNFEFTEDDWLIVNSSELHSCRYISPNDHFRGISILISLSFIESWLGEGLFFYNPHITHVTDQLITLASELYTYDTSMHNNLILMEKLFILLQLLSSQCIKKDTTYTVPFYKEQSKATEFLEYIEYHFRDELTLNQIAEHFKYSPSYFSRFFKEIVGVNFYAYLNFVRVNHATQQLLENRTTITDCAISNGFPNTKSFISMFKKLYGCTPKKFLSS